MADITKWSQYCLIESEMSFVTLNLALQQTLPIDQNGHLR